jgi:NAD(P)H dehydrogenase (quinone)
LSAKQPGALLLRLEKTLIILTGATGKLGQLITGKLLGKVRAEQIGVSVRDPGKATDLKSRGIRVRQGDFADPASLLHTFEGASQVLLISSNSSGENAQEHHRNAIHAAKQVGAQRILYTSHMGSNANSAFAPMRDHAATEEALKASGVPFTSLRNGFYAGSGVMLMGSFLQTGKVVAPQDGPVSWTAHDDLADAAVLALTGDGKLDGITAPLTSSEALDLAGLARLASELTGREITRVTVSDSEQRNTMLARGTPKHQADLSAGLFKASRANEFAMIDPNLETLLGRSPISMRQVLFDSMKKQH